MSEEEKLLDALRAGEESAFLRLVAQHHPVMVRVAFSFVGSTAVAEEVAQEAWVGVLNGLKSFEGRSSLKTWIFKILSNCARKRREREGRTKPFSAFDAPDDDTPSVPGERFLDASHPQWPGHWAAPPEPWAEEKLMSAQTVQLVKRVIEELPPGQRDVITLRDIEGWTSEEVCEALGVSEGNQRVLLHRARSRVRAAIEGHLTTGGAAA